MTDAEEAVYEHPTASDTIIEASTSTASYTSIPSLTDSPARYKLQRNSGRQEFYGNWARSVLRVAVPACFRVLESLQHTPSHKLHG